MESKKSFGKILGIIICVIAVIITIFMITASIFVSGTEKTIDSMIRALEKEDEALFSSCFVDENATTIDNIYNDGILKDNIKCSFENRDIAFGDKITSVVNATIKSGEEDARKSNSVTLALEYNKGWKISSIEIANIATE